MVSNQKLFSVGTFDFRLQHLLVIGILVLSVSISVLIRSTPAMYGIELFEYDPFFNFRATEYLINNNLQDYLQWHDEKSWYPYGRNVSDTSQVTLHISTAIFYKFFNFGISLYDFTILFPLIIGSLTSLAIFGFVRVLGGTTAGLLASLMFAVSVPIFSRGFIGWFKSEPLGLFFGFIAVYLFVSGIKNDKGKISFLKLAGAGLFLSLGLSSWGGIIFFVISILLFYFAIPFFRNKTNFILYATPIFSISLTLSLLMFERTSSFLFGYGGILILLSTVFVIVAEIIKKYSHETKQLRNCFFFLISIIISGLGVFSLGVVSLPTFRYLNAMNPLLITSDPLTDSVAEHATTSITLSFGILSIFIIFGVIGIWFLFSKKSFYLQNNMRVFTLIISLIAIYLSSAFVRLELFASIGLFVLGGIGISLLLKEVFQSQKTIPKYILATGILCLFLLPMILPENENWLSWADFSPTVLNGGSDSVRLVTYDWIDAMKWLKQNSSPDSVIVSWWDYGYWITTLSDRTTVVDNATLIDWQIKKIAFSYLSPLDDAWTILHSDYNTDISSSLDSDYLELIGNPHESDCIVPVEFCAPAVKGLGGDYIVIFSTLDKIATPGLDLDLYSFVAGGDESKKGWFAKIAGKGLDAVVLPDGFTPTYNFLNNTTLGQLLPIEIVTFVNPSTGETSQEYSPGLVAIYQKSIKLSDSETDPFYLVYASPSFYSEISGQKNMVLIYKINHDYQG
jgi:dolichyl-diphosphooligosaccharide---protein glycosyltransferase